MAAAQALAAANVCADQRSLDLRTMDVAFGIYDGGTLVGPPQTISQADALLTLLNLRTADATFVNACQATIRRDALANRPLNLFFAPLSGRPTQSISATSVAAIQRGYGLTSGARFLPIAMDITIWNALRFTNSEINAVTLKPLGVDLNSLSLATLLGNNSLLSILDQAIPLALSGSPVNVLDGYTYQRGMSRVAAGPDGIWEAVLLADQLQTVTKLGLLGKLLSGVQRIPSLFITLETGVGGSAPNAARLSNVIRNGLSDDDVQRISGSSSGEVWLPFSMPGYFEIPNDCEADLISIIGQPRFIPLYATLPGTVNKVTDVLGLSHTFQFVGWGGVVITEVNLHGPIRYINVEPAIFAHDSIRPAAGENAWRANAYLSDGVFTAPRLVQ